MAPILATAAGVAVVEYRSESLGTLWKALSSTKDRKQLVQILETRGSGAEVFGEEQVDLHQWIPPLNNLDALLTQMLREYPLLLILPASSSSSTGSNSNSNSETGGGSTGETGSSTSSSSSNKQVQAKACHTLEDVHSVPGEIWDLVLLVLSFYADLLKNASSKNLFNSVSEVLELLAASRDDVAHLALEVLQFYSIPPSTSKCPPDCSSSSPNNAAVALPGGRLVAIAVAHKSAGFLCWPNTSNNVCTNAEPAAPAAADEAAAATTAPPPPPLVHFAYHTEYSEEVSFVSLTEQDFRTTTSTTTAPAISAADTPEISNSNNEYSKKRRRVGSSTTATPTLSSSSFSNSSSPTSGSRYKSTAEVFLLATASQRKAKKETTTTKAEASQEEVAQEEEQLHRMMSAQFALLCHIRVAKWDLEATRRCCSTVALEWRLKATLCLLYTASVDTMSLFMSAQSPEWFVSITKLLKDMVADVSECNTLIHGDDHYYRHDGILGLSSDTPPFSLKLLAAQTLAALVSRRDSSRVSSVLQELGVGKSQTFGILPMLLRYALAALVGPVMGVGQPPPVVTNHNTEDAPHPEPTTEDPMDIGVAFLEGTLPEPLPRATQVARALEMIEALLTLTAAVTSNPSGTASLVDAGLIPSLLTTISTTDILQRLECPITPVLEAQVRFLTAQAVQILDSAIVTHNQALSGFFDLDGVKVLTTRVTQEVQSISSSQDSITPSQRILLFSIVTCLTGVFHQESANLGGTTVRKPELAAVLIQILENAHVYGGALAALLSTLLSDVMNSDPHIVHYIHTSGIARAFLAMIGNSQEVQLPTVPELIMVVPNVLAALALTEDGAKAVAAYNPFPPLLQVFHHPRYAMPQSRCLLSEMTSIVGTGLDEICRHVDRLKPLVLQAVAQAVSNVVAYAEDLGRREELAGEITLELETERTCLIQYVLNLGQLLEQILHNEDHCDPFVEAGGLDALFRVFPSSMSGGSQFLAHVSCMSSPTVSTLHHSTIEDSLSVAFKCIQFRYNPGKLIRKVMLIVSQHFDALDESRRELFDDGDHSWSLDALPCTPLHKIDVNADTRKIASFLRHVALVQWSTHLLAVTIKAVCQRSQDTSNGWSPSEREWKQEITKDDTIQLLGRLSSFYRRSLFEVCRVRTERGFEEEEKERFLTRSCLRYRLRIVCPEGAVVRDGVEIDSCANVGSMELGEVVESFDRCINSSGILRYRTSRGWVSEMTRGHGREPIAEVISFSESEVEVEARGKRIEIAIPTLRTIGLGVLSRGQASMSELFGALSKLSLQSIRTIPVRAVSFDPDTVGDHVARTLRFLSSNLSEAMNLPEVIHTIQGSTTADVVVSREGVAMYYGCLLSLMHACLFDEKRERRIVNLPLLLSLASSDPFVDRLAQERDLLSASTTKDQTMGIFGASLYVFQESIIDFCRHASAEQPDQSSNLPVQRVSRYVAASFPPVVALFRRLLSTPLTTSPVASVMSRVRWQDLPLLLGKKDLVIAFSVSPGEGFFEPERFVSGLQIAISSVVKKAWLDPDFVKSPPHLVHPVVSLIGDVIVGLEDSCKKKPSATNSRASNGFNLSDYFRQRQRQEEAEEEEEEEFVVEEGAVSMLVEMGFDRDRAIDAFESTRSNRVEVAMEYALSHAPPSPATIQRRRIEREERQRQRAESQAASAQEAVEPQNGQSIASNPDVVDLVGNAETSGATHPMDVDDAPVVTGAGSSASGKESLDLFSAKAELSAWMDDGPLVCCRLLANIGDVAPRASSGREAADGNGESEALTVVLCSFLLDLCHSYPDKRSGIVSQILAALKEKLVAADADLSALSNSIPQSSEASVAALCHAAVLFTRALPKMRGLILQNNLVGYIVAGISTALKNPCNESGSPAARRLPSWLAPALLLIDILAQPVVEFTDDDLKALGTEPKEEGELAEVQKEHRAQAEELAEFSTQIFSVVSAVEPSKDEKSLFAAVPAYFPLLPLKYVDACRDICLELLGAGKAASTPPPGVAHATMLLLLRLLRSPKNSAVFRRLGTAEAILKLPKESKFTGNTGLVALIFRRLLEDEVTLQNSMELEMRATVAKLQAKKSSAVNDKPPVPLHSFIEAVTPLMCRDTLSFLKAICVSVKVESKSKPSQSADLIVSLLPPDERVKRAASFTDVLGRTSDDNGGRSASRTPRNSSAQKSRGKSPHKNNKRHSVSKYNKKGQKGTSPQVTSGHPEPTAATHVTSLLINAIIMSSAVSPVSCDDKSFLWVGNLLEVLCELVLAVPACACAVHNYRPHRVKDKSTRASLASHIQHALDGCPSPPKNFVSFLLHSLLPQDRWSLRLDHQVWDRRKGSDEKEIKMISSKRERAYRITKVSHATARLILALVSRPGEGRRRVIADLIFALSGGRLGHGSAHSSTSSAEGDGSSIDSTLSDQNALHAWAELSLGIVAPRSTGKSVDGITALNAENIRLSLEHGMVHALLYALHRVKLFHPMSTSTCGALLMPLECLTRGSVNDAVKQLAEKEKDKSAQGPRVHANIGDTDLVQSVIEPRREGLEYDLIEAEEVEMAEGGAEESDDESHSSNEEEASSDESDVESSGVEDSSQSMEAESQEEEGSSDEESQSGSSEEEVDDEGDWNLNYADGFVPDNNTGDTNNEYDTNNEFVEEEEGTERVEHAIEDGWHRIETQAFGGMLIGSRNVNGGERIRSRGFMEAAEAMIGSILQNGEINNETIRELEGSLGIRIMSNNSRALGEIPGNSLGETFAVRVLGEPPAPPGADHGRRSEAIGTLPHIHQRSQPDVGYSAFASGGRLPETSSMEFVYGGPSVTGCSRNYDLLNSDSRSEGDAQGHLTQLDLQLFPGGPASIASAGTQHSLHPLLCGVDLPPVNALVSDLLPHGVRATRQGQITTRRPGDWTNAAFAHGGYLVSTSTGNIIRSSRPHSGAPLGSSGLTARHVVGPVGWTDDGLPVDATVEEFSSAFERAVANVISTTSQQHSTQEGRGEADGGGNSAAVTEPNPEASTSDVVMADVDNQDPVEAAEHDEDALPAVQSSSASDGDGVASSLAQGLRLSPGSEPGNNLDSMSTTNVLAREASLVEQQPEMDSPMADAAVIAAPQREDSGEEEGAAEENANRVDAEGAGNVPSGADIAGEPNVNGLVCPPDVDLDVFNSLPFEMQQDCVNQYNATQELASQLDGSSLDPEFLAALPEDMRREVIEQDRRERQVREEAESQADPANAQEMDNASFIASLSPELREEILLTADEAFLSSLPPNIVVEAQILRERASNQHRRLYEEGTNVRDETGAGDNFAASSARRHATQSAVARLAGTSRKKARSGKMRVECNRDDIIYRPNTLPAAIGKCDLMLLFRMMYLMSPVRPPRLLHKVFHNLMSNPVLRSACSSAFVGLLHDNREMAREAVESLTSFYSESDTWRRTMDDLFSPIDFPPSAMIGAAPSVPDSDVFSLGISASVVRRKQGQDTAAAIAANLQTSAGNSLSSLPPVVCLRLVETLQQLCKSSSQFCLHILVGLARGETGSSAESSTCFELLLDLLETPVFSTISSNLDQLLSVLENAVVPLSHIPKQVEEEQELAQKDLDAAAAAGKEWVDVPRVTVSQARLQNLCSILRNESCRDSSFTKVNTIVRRLCRIESNRGYVLAELASVADGLGSDAVSDLKALKIRLDQAASHHQLQLVAKANEDGSNASTSPSPRLSSSITLSTSSSELKLLRVLQTLQTLCLENWQDSSSKKTEVSVIVTEELVHLLRRLDFTQLWDELTSCLSIVQVLEGVKGLESADVDHEDANAADDVSGEEHGEDRNSKKKLRNSAAGLLTRFLPAIEAFFVANASATRPVNDTNESLPGKMDDIPLDNLVGGQRLLAFVATNRVLLNALVRNNPGLLEKGFRALAQVPRCRGFLDFDVKQQWFKTQMRRLRQHASRRHGSLRLHIRRKYVFEDAYHQLRLRNADEVRGRLHITFRNEEGVDAGGLSREFFGILAKEIFNRNYALFTSTEDGCTFQPNPNSSINPDHLSYFRFVGRIVGKAVSDGFLLDAHFTRSLYKHMLGMKPTYHDMEAIDPDYYRNLKTILEYNLDDLGLELNFCIEDHSFGRSQTIDLIPGGRSVHVTEENKEEYVLLVCQHRMTTAIQSQIKAYLDGFYELVPPELVAIFTPRELELLISGLPDIDVHDLKKNTEYAGWKATDKEIEWFWNILFALSRNEKASFLQFVTGSSKVPLAGFSELQGMRGIQKFSIHKTTGKAGALMSAHTCFNSLDLPNYSSEEEMRGKLLYAINEGGGAFLFA